MATYLLIRDAENAVDDRSLRSSSEVGACRGRSFRRPLAPPVEVRKVARVPGLAESGGTQVPVGPDLARHGAKVAAEVLDGGAAPEPVAVVDAVDHEPGLEHERVRDHRIVLRVGVLLNVEVLLNRPLRV